MGERAHELELARGDREQVHGAQGTLKSDQHDPSTSADRGDRRAGREGGAAGFDDDMRTLANRRVDHLLQVGSMDRIRAVGAQRGSCLQAARVDVDGHDVARATCPCGGDHERADSADADHDARLGARQSAAVDGMQRDCQRLRQRGGIVVDAVGDAADRAARDANVFGESAVNVEAKGLIAGTEVRPAGGAPLAASAPDSGTRNDSLARCEPGRLRLRTTVDDFAHELVAEHDRRTGKHRTVVPFGCIGAADSGATHPHQDVGCVDNARDWTILDRDVVRSAIHGGFHTDVAMWTLMLRAVSRAAANASVADASGIDAVTIRAGSTMPRARKRIVCGHTPTEPTMPCKRTDFDWINPSLAGAVEPTLIPTYATRAKLAATSSAVAIAVGAPAASITASKPLPAVAALAPSTNAGEDGSRACAAPSWRAHWRRPASGSIATTRALQAAAAIIESSPIGPAPITATVSLGSTPPRQRMALYATLKGSTRAA